MKNDIDISLKKALIESEELVVPEIIASGIDNILEDLNNDKTKMKIKPIRRMNKVIKIAIIALVFLSVTKTIDVFANGNAIKQIINSAVEKIIPKSSNPIQDAINYKDSEIDPYKNVIEQSITDNGVTIQLNEVVLDEKELIIAYTVIQNKEDFSKILMPHFDLYINNKEIIGGSSGGSHINVDKNTRRYIHSKDIDSNNLEGELNIKLVFGKGTMFFKEDDFLQGSWQFEFTIDREKLMSNVRRININKSINISKDDVITVDNISVTPISTTVYYTYKHEGVITDSKNMPELDFTMYDQNGTKISPMGANFGYHATDTGAVGGGYLRCVKLKSDVSKVKIVPHIVNQNKNSTYNKELKSQVIEAVIK